MTLDLKILRSFLPALFLLVGSAEAADLVVSPCDPNVLNQAIATANSNIQPDVIRFDVSDPSRLSCCDRYTRDCPVRISSPIVLYEDETTLIGPDRESGYTVTIDGSSSSLEAGVKVQGAHETIKNLGFKNFSQLAVLIEGRWHSVTGAVLQDNRFANNGSSQAFGDCPRVSNNPYMDGEHGVYYGTLLRDVGASFPPPPPDPARGYPGSSGGPRVGITAFTGTPSNAVASDVTGDSACGNGIDFQHALHAALVSIGSGSHATVLLDERLANSKEEAQAFVQSKIASSQTATVDYFYKNVFVPRRDGNAYDYQFPPGRVFACTCYSPQVYVHHSDGATPFGAVKIQYASNNLLRGNAFSHNGFGVGVIGGSAPANFNTITENSFTENRRAIDLQQANQGISPPVITKAVLHGALGTVSYQIDAGSIVELYDYDSGVLVGTAPTTSDHTFNCSADLLHTGVVWATVTDPRGNTSSFSDPVPIDAIRNDPPRPSLPAPPSETPPPVATTPSATPPVPPPPDTPPVTPNTPTPVTPNTPTPVTPDRPPSATPPLPTVPPPFAAPPPFAREGEEHDRGSRENEQSQSNGQSDFFDSDEAQFNRGVMANVQTEARDSQTEDPAPSDDNNAADNSSAAGGCALQK